MTVVTKYMNTKPEKRQDARLWNNAGTWEWSAQNDGGIGFTAGEYYIARMFLDVPQGATITSAQFLYTSNQKDGAPAQYVDLTLAFEAADNSAPWPYVTDTLIPGTTPPTFPRTLGTSQSMRYNYPGGNTPDPDVVTWTVTSQLQAIVNRAGWEAGSYITLAQLCTAEGPSSDMDIQTVDNDFAAQQPQIKLSYSFDNDTAARTEVNLLLNETMANADEVFNNSLYGYSMDNTTYETAPTSGRDGGPCLKVVAHPPAGQETRAVVALQGYPGMGGETYVLSGWFYNPSSNNANFGTEFIFQGGWSSWPHRDVWRPFASTPFTCPSGGVALWCAFQLLSGLAKSDGAWFLIDDVCLTRTNTSEMPFTGATTDKFNADYQVKETTSHGVSVRRNRARTHVLLSGVSKPRRGYVCQGDSKPWIRSDPQKLT